MLCQGLCQGIRAVSLLRQILKLISRILLGPRILCQVGSAPPWSPHIEVNNSMRVRTQQQTAL